jgi:hypothetical protein
MTKYGLFSGDSAQPDQTYEGDYINEEKRVLIFEKGARGRDKQVAAIRLREGQRIRQMEDSSSRGLEPQSKINIGLLLLRGREELGEAYPKFRRECVKKFRKSESTLNRYVALAGAASHRFARSRAVKEALFPIWNAEECFDPVTGELKPVVDEAIKACNGIPEDADSVTAEEWARKFVATVDALVKDRRRRWAYRTALRSAS